MADINQVKNPSFFQKHFSKIADEETALKLAKEGAIAGFIIFLMEAGGVIFAYFGTDPTTGHRIDQDTLNNLLLRAVILLPIILFFSWRVKTGKGYISAGLLLCLFLYEVFSKVTNGTTNVGWIFFYIIIATSLISGLRACWYLKKTRKTESKNNC